MARSASTWSSTTASTRPLARSEYGCTSSSYDTAVMPWLRSASSSRLYAMVPPRVATRLPRRSARVRRPLTIGFADRHGPHGTRSRERWRPATGAVPGCLRRRSSQCRSRLCGRTDRATEPDLDELRWAVQSDAISSAISTSKPATLLGSAASASTNGAPPSASPPLPQGRGGLGVGRGRQQRQP